MDRQLAMPEHTVLHRDVNALSPRDEDLSMTGMTGGTSQHFEYVVDGTVGEAVADPDRDDAIEPAVGFRGCLEHRRDAEVIARGVDPGAS
jgi:hypothetical protein